VAPGVWLTLLLAVVVALLLSNTIVGRHIFAIGSNENTARLCGVRVERTKFYVYTLGGILTGFAGLMQFSRLTVGDPTAAKGMELDIIAAVVIGGGSLQGGEGSVAGSVAGAMLMAVIRNGLSMKGVPNWVQDVLTGSIIVAAWRLTACVTATRVRRSPTALPPVCAARHLAKPLDPRPPANCRRRRSGRHPE
jgi:ribose/xylose/arabinose/galactoside ABC-type transport system permease subunit